MARGWHVCGGCTNSFRSNYHGRMPRCVECREPPLAALAAPSQAPGDWPSLVPVFAEPGIVVGRLAEVTRTQLANTPAVNIIPSLTATGTTVPEYFSSTNAAPALIAYKENGFNWKRAESMFNESILDTCREGQGCCQQLTEFLLENVVDRQNSLRDTVFDCVEDYELLDHACNELQAHLADRPLRFPVLSLSKMRRLENVQIFERFSQRERQIAADMLMDGQNSDPRCLPSTHSWLQRLGEKNGLSEAANTRYLLHGTQLSALPSILQHGVCTKFTQEKPLYGRGAYFTDSACKASQYGNRINENSVILVCRVILGKCELLHEPSRQNFARANFHSAHAKGGECVRLSAIRAIIHNISVCLGAHRRHHARHGKERQAASQRVGRVQRLRGVSRVRAPVRVAGPLPLTRALSAAH